MVRIRVARLHGTYVMWLDVTTIKNGNCKQRFCMQTPNAKPLSSYWTWKAFHLILSPGPYILSKWIEDSFGSSWPSEVCDGSSASYVAILQQKTSGLRGKMLPTGLHNGFTMGGALYPPVFCRNPLMGCCNSIHSWIHISHYKRILGLFQNTFCCVDLQCCAFDISHAVMDTVYTENPLFNVQWGLSLPAM